MNWFRLVYVLVLIPMLFVPCYGNASEKDALTNDMVIKMVKAKLSEPLIIKKIQTSNTSFDLSTESIIKLNGAGVSEKIIEAMLGGDSQNSQPQQSQLETQFNNPMDFEGVSVMDSGKRIDLEVSKFEYFVPPSSIAKFFIPFMPHKSERGTYANGSKSKVRLSDNRPTFVVRTFSKHSEDVNLIKTIVHSGKDIRYFTAIQRGSTGTEFVLAKDEYKVTCDSKRTKNGLEVTPKEPLPPGEYIVTTVTGFGLGYDFGIDEPEGVKKTEESHKENNEEQQ